MKKNKIEKIYIVRFVLVILILLNCVTIFKFSSEKSEKSNKTSGIVVEKIIESNPKTRNLAPKEKQKKKEEIVTPVRKTAHFTVYTILGMLLYLLTKTFNCKERNRIIISLGLAFLYACSDEVHQSLVPGRSCEFRDICIDSCGALFGILIVWGIMAIMWKTKVKNSRKKLKILEK